MKHGFSLVELSIVLVILGLLVGGVLSGQALIRASELRAVSSEFSRYATATLSFRDKYLGLPGDITNATSFWGAPPASIWSGNDPVTTPPMVGTFNGDGNGKVIPYGNPAPGVYAHQETGAFWQQLADAGLIEGQYNGSDYYHGDGETVSGNISYADPRSSPVSRAGSNIYWGIKYMAPVWLSYTTVPSGHIFMLSSGYGIYSGDPTIAEGGVVLTPSEMWNIDTKLDDGVPNTGKVIAPNNNTSQGGSNAFGNCMVISATLWQYDLTSSNKTCAPVFYGGF